jgi:hypothetical protein
VRQAWRASGLPCSGPRPRCTMSDLFAPLTLPSSVMTKNRFRLAPLTNCQSHEDGCLSEEAFRGSS